jgi:hypothetical protein
LFWLIERPHDLAATSGVMVLEHKQDDISQIKVIWDDFFSQQIVVTCNASKERKVGG